MFDAFYISATGMQTHQASIDTVANNLANMNTTAYKRAKVTFTDLVVNGAMSANPSGYSTAGPRALDSYSGVAAVGAGVGVAANSKVFDAAAVTSTGSDWDIAIEGDGLIQVALGDGSTAYVRGGTLKVNSDGLLATQAGYVLKPSIAVPKNASSIAIGTDGTVRAVAPNQSSDVVLGRLDLVRFANESALATVGDNLYQATDGSGEPLLQTAADGAATIRQGALEGSNVNLTDELVNLMAAKRAYEANLKVVQAADEVLGMVNNLRK